MMKGELEPSLESDGSIKGCQEGFSAGLLTAITFGFGDKMEKSKEEFEFVDVIPFIFGVLGFLALPTLLCCGINFPQQTFVIIIGGALSIILLGFSFSAGLTAFSVGEDLRREFKKSQDD